MIKKQYPLVWDEQNREHIRKHGVTIAEVEEVYSNPAVSFEAKNRRQGIIAKVKNGRMIAVFLSFEKQKGPYVVSARDAGFKERGLFYDQTKTNQTI